MVHIQMYPKNCQKKTIFHIFYTKNLTETSRRATKIGMHMRCAALSVQLKNHANWKKNLFGHFLTHLKNEIFDFFA